MPALIGGLAAATVRVEADHVGSVGGLTMLAAVAAGVAGFAAVRWYRRGAKSADLLVAAALHRNRQADRDDRIIATANRAQVQL
jgi:hypothetical protein